MCALVCPKRRAGHGSREQHRVALQAAEIGEAQRLLPSGQIAGFDAGPVAGLPGGGGAEIVDAQRVEEPVPLPVVDGNHRAAGTFAGQDLQLCLIAPQAIDLTHTLFQVGELQHLAGICRKSRTHTCGRRLARSEVHAVVA
ncbi:MAG: hypothetical protein H6R11_2048, partial [Proteobacteria bacterium]|nr:hypothetical protein [Pseudomonadota bacterium]